MKSFIVLLALISILFSFPISSEVLNQTAINLCENYYFNCTRLSCYEDIVVANDSDSFQNCDMIFEQCMQNTAYAAAPKPVECFRSDAAWTDFYVSLIFSISMYIAGNIVVPALLKLSASYSAGILV